MKPSILPSVKLQPIIFTSIGQSYPMELRYHSFDLPLKHPFTISRGTTTSQPTLIVELRADGQHGYGEATTNSFYGATLENMTAALESVRPAVESHRLQNPAALWESLDPALCDNRFAQCALDMAAHDLWGKLRGAPVRRLWGLQDSGPLSSYTIGLDDIDVMVEKLREEPGWPMYKVKLGSTASLKIIRELRKHTAAPYRVDANWGWNAAETLQMAMELQRLNVEFIEQPLPAGDVTGIQSLTGICPLPLIADESCATEADVESCHQAGFDGVNIKLVKCGGLTPARRMIESARAYGLKVMAGCMTESTVGISSIAQLLPLLDYVDIDGAALLSADIASGVRIVDGKCIYPAVDGCGVELLR